MVSLQYQLDLLSQRIHAPDAATSTSSSASRRPRPHTMNLSTPEQFPSGTNLTKKPPRRLPSTASKVVCTSSPSPFVDVIPHIGSLSTTFQIQIQTQFYKVLADVHFDVNWASCRLGLPVEITPDSLQRRLSPYWQWRVQFLLTSTRLHLGSRLLSHSAVCSTVLLQIAKGDSGITSPNIIMLQYDTT